MNFLDFNSSKLTSFEPGEFYSEGFSVDEFIQRKRYSVPLDVLRDDLGSHLKFLRTSLIELINQDYGQFVNLSSNLVGLDGRIQNITGPLTRAQSDLESLQDALTKTLTVLQAELQDKKALRVAKAHLQFLRLANSSLESAEKYLMKLPEDVQTSGDFTTLKIACEKIAETKVLIRKCNPSPLLQELNKRWESCSKTVLNKLEALLTTYASLVPPPTTKGKDDDNDTANIVRSLLFMYAQLEAETTAETIFVHSVLKPKCDGVLSQKGNVSALLDSLEEFQTRNPIMLVSQELEDFPWMRKYDFVSRGIFPHVVKILSQKFPHIWSPSTPDSFHANWIRCEKFIESLESALPSEEQLNNLRNSEVFKEFVGKWQFNVYFQLRFHTLAIELESALDSLESHCVSNEFKLDSTRVLVKVIQQCWDKDKIFIWQLSGRFLKASALFVSRYLKEIHRQITSKSKVETSQLLSASSDVSRSEEVVRDLLRKKLEEVSKWSPSSDPLLLKESQAFLSAFEWTKTREDLESRLIEVTVSQSLANISSVTEVPRLFRRTNREVPTKHSEYVNGILEPIQSLRKDMGNQNQAEGNLLQRVGQQALNRYIVQVEEVLTSVQRMEESLKRLKKVKGQNATISSGGDGNGSTVLSDDDKIRRQIQIDVEYFVSQVKAICPLVDTTSAQKQFDKK